MSKLEKYFSKHPYLNALVHICGGIGVGILFTHEVFDPHPVRFGSAFLGFAIGGYVYVLSRKK